MARAVYQEDITKDNLNASPYIRVNRTAALNLTATWQDVVFNGSSASNTNSFPMSPMGNGGKTVYLHADGRTFMFNSEDTRTYSLDLDYRVMGGTLSTTIFARFVVPAPTPIYFPFPDTVGRFTLATLLPLNEVREETYTRRIYSTPALRQYGLRVQVMAVSLTLTPPQLQEANMFLYGY